jgi:hypothetical protein
MVAGRGDFAGANLGRVGGDWRGGIGNRESLNAVERLLRILMSCAVKTMTSSAESAVEIL